MASSLFNSHGIGDDGMTRTVVFDSDAVFAEIKERAATEPELVIQADKLVCRFVVTGAKGEIKNWLVDLKQDPPFVGHDDSLMAEIDVILSDEMFMTIAAGKIKPAQAFITGQIKVKGAIIRAMKLETIFNPSTLKLQL